jgi:hypothetical protein
MHQMEVNKKRAADSQAVAKAKNKKLLQERIKWILEQQRKSAAATELKGRGVHPNQKPGTNDKNKLINVRGFLFFKKL